MTSDRNKKTVIRVPKGGSLPPCPYTVNERWMFLDMAAEKAEESKCDRSKVGAALVRPDGKLIHVAYNEVSPGHGDHTCKDFCPRGAKSYEELPYGSEPMDDCNSLHAEFAAVQLAIGHMKTFAKVEGELNQENLKALFEGYWMFITKQPCEACKMYIQGLGIRYQYATSWERRVVREGVLTIVNPPGEGAGKPGGSADNAD